MPDLDSITSFETLAGDGGDQPQAKTDGADAAAEQVGRPDTPLIQPLSHPPLSLYLFLGACTAQAATEGAKLSPDTVEAARNLDAVIGNLCKNFSDSVDYFKVLVDVFRNELTSKDKNSHLANFFVIIPALTVNFVEQILQAKDLMYKSHRKKESYFSDDGFAIGVAYILAILDQVSEV